MSFQQGLSGLNAASKSLEVIGNNVANSSTVGFKQSKAIFSDVYANSLNGSGASQIGIGVNLNAVSQQFTQGNITGTNNSLDISINGSGFFRMSEGGEITYSRNGQFQLDKLGYITDATGTQRLTGYAADSDGTLDKGSAQEIQIDYSDLVPSASTAIETKVNLDSRNDDLTDAGFDPDDPTSYHNSTSITAYDSLGNSHTVQTFYLKTTDNTWSAFVTVDGDATYTGTTPNGVLTFDSTGISPTSTPDPLNFTYTTSTGSDDLDIDIDLTNSTQFGSTFSVNKNTQDGYASGTLASFDTGDDGIIVGRYTNGQSRTLGQVVLATFPNMNGLKPLGGNAWGESSDSGSPLLGEPGTSQLGVLQSSSTEDSNVDLTAELVNMITAQRVYQANAQTIKTQDQVMQTLVNLR